MENIKQEILDLKKGTPEYEQLADDLVLQFQKNIIAQDLNQRRDETAEDHTLSNINLINKELNFRNEANYESFIELTRSISSNQIDPLLTQKPQLQYIKWAIQLAKISNNKAMEDYFRQLTSEASR